ncbi:MAG: hypothetical protein K0Q80_1124 [Microvirga sp.]|nr:hypothetical protein [Microvirga sp.]
MIRPPSRPKRLLTLAPSSDTLGIFGATVADAVYVFDAINPAYLTPCDNVLQGKAYRIAFLEDPHLEVMQCGVMESCQALMQKFASAGAKVDLIPSSISFARLNELQNSTVSYKIGHTLGHLLHEPIGALSRSRTANLHSLGRARSICRLVHSGEALSWLKMSYRGCVRNRRRRDQAPFTQPMWLVEQSIFLMRSSEVFSSRAQPTSERQKEGRVR